VLVVTLGIFMFSLLGLPPLAGFTAKFQIFQVLFEAADHYNKAGQPWLAWTLYGVVIGAGFNTVLSLFYYAKVLKVMALEAQPRGGRRPARPPDAVARHPRPVPLGVGRRPARHLCFLGSPRARQLRQGVNSFLTPRP